MSVLFSDVKLQIKDFLTNYSTGTIDLGNIDRAANRAIEFVQRRLGLPSDKKIQSFYFYEDTYYYDCTTGFNELLGISYNISANQTAVDYNPNVPNLQWTIFKDIEILRSTGIYPDTNRIGFTTLNGKNQYLMHGRNQRGSYTVNPFNNTSGITNSTDITSVSQDSNVYKYGAASVKFNIGTGLSASYLHFTGLWDITKLLNVNAAYKLYVDFPTGTTGYFTNVELRLQSSTGNYYSMTTTNQDDGTAWNSGSWSRLAWFLANATTTGSPSPSLITDIYVYFNHSGTFAATTGMRVNYLYQITPDYMDVLYYSAYKGTDSVGTTNKIILDDDSDICSFGSYAPDLILPIAIKGAQMLSPQIMQDLNFRAMYKQDFDETIKMYGRTYPRERATGQFGAHQLKRI